MKAIALLLLASTATGTAATPDPTEAALERCLDDPENASTGGQTDCQTVAKQSYDRRMNAAYGALMKKLPVDVRQRLRLSQRTWLAFRDADTQAQSAFYVTRQGTMYVPMQAASQTAVIRDRTVQLETWDRVFAIDE